LSKGIMTQQELIENRDKVSILLQLLIEEIEKVFSLISEEKMQVDVSYKADGSLVTSVDLLVDQIAYDLFSGRDEFKGWSYISEERSDNKLQFPAFILDPIDGTSDFYRKTKEFSVSLCFMLNESCGFGAIYFPASKTLIQNEKFTILTAFSQKNIFSRNSNELLVAMVSKSELNIIRQHFVQESQGGKEHFIGRGSIALKLALLKTGASDFVLTIKNKGLWDVAAAIFILQEHNIHMFNRHEEILSLNQLELEGPMLWCEGHHRDRLDKYLHFSSH